MFSFFYKSLEEQIPIEDQKPEPLLSYIPPQVNPELLNPNLNVLDDATLQRLKEELSQEKFKLKRISKKELGIPYGAYNGNQDFAAIFNKDGEQFQVGEGGQGKIKLAQLASNEWKILKTQRIVRGRESFLNECKVLYELGKTDEPEGIIRGYKGNILMHLAKGTNLNDLLNKRNELVSREIHHPHFWPEIIWLQIAIHVANEIRMIHSKNILHRDIKLENFMFDIARQIVEAIDFGLARKCDDKEGQMIYESYHLSGTNHYIAPELRKQIACLYNEATEVYALGVLYRHILLNHDIEQKDGQRTERLLDPAQKKTILETDSELGVVAFLDKMTHEDPKERPTMNEVTRNLNIIFDTFSKKYPEQLSQAKKVFASALEKERRRLEMFHQRKRPPLENLEELKKFMLEEKDENRVIKRMKEMSENRFAFSKQDKKDLFSLMVVIVQTGHLAAFTFLAQKGVDLGMQEYDKTPAMIAAMSGNKEAIIKLIELGIDVNRACGQNTTAGIAEQCLLLAKEKDKDKFREILSILHEACIEKTKKEYSQTFLPTLLSPTLDSRLEENLKTAGLLSYAQNHPDLYEYDSM